MKAIVLSGGGSKGSYQIGVWKALKKLRIKYDIVTGTSVGALNGALMTQNTYWKAIKVWKKINFQTLFDENKIEKEPKKNLEMYKMYGENIIKNGGMDVKKLEKIIEKNINKKKFFNSKVNFGLVTFNLNELKPTEISKDDIPQEKLTDYLMASATCYPAFKKKKINDNNYIDGGFYDNLPINLAIKLGADEIIAIDLKAPGLKKKPKKKISTITITPNNKLSNFLNFSEDEIKKNIKYGYNDTMKIFNKLEGHQYTFKKNTLKKTINQYSQTYKYLLENVLEQNFSTNTLKKIFKINGKLNNEELENKILNIMDELGKEFNLDDNIIYSKRKFNKKVKKEFKTKMHYYKLYNEKNKMIDIYKLIENKDKKKIKKELLINSKDFFKALYLYTIRED